jgi:ATP-binding cassette, subfamily B, bacterial
MYFKFFHQPDSMDCGPTCLQMIAKYYGKHFSLQGLRMRTQIGKEGVNMLGISEAAESIGFRSKAVRLNYEQLVQDALCPLILHWNQNHFVVLYKVKKNHFYIADPGIGLMQLTKNEFLQRWISDKNDAGEKEGIALLLEPSPKFYEDDEDSIESEQRRSKMAFKNIFTYIIPYKKLVFQLLLGLGIASILQLILPFLTQSVVDVGINASNIHFVYIVLFAQMALFSGRLTTDFVRSWILLHISSRINISILTDFLIKLMRLPLAYFDSKKTGDILQRMNDHHRIESFLTGTSISTLFSIANLVIFSFVLVFFNVHVFTVFFVASILYSAWVIIFLKQRRILDYKRFDIGSREQGTTIQLVQSMQEIKLNGVEKSMRWNWERLQAKLFKLNMKGLALNQWQQSGASFINESKNIFITFLSAKAVIEGEMTFGTMIAIQYIIGQLNSPIEQLINFAQSWQNAKISMERLNEIHGMEDEEPNHKFFIKELPLAFTKQLIGGKKSGFTISGERPIIENGSQFRTNELQNSINEPSVVNNNSCIKCKNVSFTYPGAGNQPILRNLNVEFPKSKTTALVGMSGSGKTTLLKLLLKFYELQEGEISLDSISLNELSHKVWRGHCGVVMQESFIFSDTIARNIALGDEKIDLEKLQMAVSIASLHDFIESLPLRLNTKIGQDGTGISMGQKQRILIARAVYRDPQFVFFDEATNCLDANNESVILNNLEIFFKGKTVLIVAHRLSTVKKADQIIVLDKGFIVEKGTHRELVQMKGEYYALVRNQLDLGE